MMNVKKKDRNYIPVLDQPIEKLKEIGKPVNFNALMKQVLSYKIMKKKKSSQ